MFCGAGGEVVPNGRADVEDANVARVFAAFDELDDDPATEKPGLHISIALFGAVVAFTPPTTMYLRPVLGGSWSEIEIGFCCSLSAVLRISSGVVRVGEMASTR